VEAREKRGLELAAKKALKRKGPLWIVPSAAGNGAYVADFENTACSCPDFETRGGVCKHLWAVQFTLQREVTVNAATGIRTEIETVSVKKTYRQDWSAYNAAQTTEKARVAELLHALCSGIVQPPRGKGRPRHLLSDIVFSCGMKVFLGSSGRRSMSDFADFKARGLVTKAPSFNSVFDYLDESKLTPLLKALIEESANPLKAVETSFAVDSSGFSTSTKTNYFENKYGEASALPSKGRRKFIKCHAMIGVRTHVVTSVEVTEGNENDSPYLPGLVDATARRFEAREISADKGYLSNANLEAIEATGAAAYIPFKLNSQGSTGSETWRRLFHFFSLERETFLSRYHQRSNVETVFSMVKAKFGGSVRSRTDVAQKNEVLLKVLLHNLCCLVMAMHELGLEPKFWPETGRAAS
jgi:transposase